MNFNKGSNYQKVMSRMEWFRDLKVIFNKLVPEEDILTPVDKLLIVKELNIRASKLDLKDPEEYYTKSKVQAFSLCEILAHINSLEDQSVNFDQLIDSLIYLSIDKKRREKKALASLQGNPNIDQIAPKSCESWASNPSCSELTSVSLQSSNRSEGKVISIIKLQDASTKIINDGNRSSIRSTTPTKSSTLDLSYPESKLCMYPESRNMANLQCLSLAGNNLVNTRCGFPQSLIILNLASNRISELKFDVDLPNLGLLNLTSNQISSISGINQFKNIKELYLANNCITSLNLFCHLAFLTLLDASHNEIETFEDIAGLVISKKIGILKLRGNTLSSKQNYEKIVGSILPRIYSFDPLNIIELSFYKNFGSLPFLPIKNLLEEANEKNMSSVRSEASLIVKRKQSSLGDYSPVDKQKSSKITNKLSKPMNSHSRGEMIMKRSSSQIRIDRSPAFTNTTKTSIDLTDYEDFTKKNSDFFAGQNIMEMAERRIKVFRQDSKGKANISVVSNESIQNAGRKVYGNPVAAMMIGPPAVRAQKSRGPSKSPACVNIDLFKKRRSK